MGRLPTPGQMLLALGVRPGRTARRGGHWNWHRHWSIGQSDPVVSHWVCQRVRSKQILGGGLLAKLAQHLLLLGSDPNERLAEASAADQGLCILTMHSSRPGRSVVSRRARDGGRGDGHLEGLLLLPTVGRARTERCVSEQDKGVPEEERGQLQSCV